MNLTAIQERVAQQTEQRLQHLTIADTRLAEAMHYGVMNGGKRLRPYLVYATAEAFGAVEAVADVAAVAIEMIHSYSLIHDDLPAMDDDDLRRGKPTCHIAFDEATAILAGDALLTAAFELLATASELTDSQRLRLIRVLGQGAGAGGMVAGQCIDLGHVGKAMTLDELENMHRHKTGALIRAAVLMGAACAQSVTDLDIDDALLRYADAIGLAFQVQDDILDIEGETEILGKTQGADMALNKPTYPALLGLDGAREYAQKLVSEAHAALAELNVDTSTLAALADYIIERDH